MTTIMLDLDGTLVDPARGIIGGFRRALAALGEDRRPDEELRWIIGPPLRKSFAHVLGADGRVEDAITHYRSFYSDTGIFDASAYDGIHAALAALRRRASRLFVCTSKPRPFAERVIAHFNFGSHFDAVYGAELDGRFDDKGDLIAHIIEREGLAADETCMIGDRLHDILAARRHDLKSVGVLWGYGSRDELLDAGATALCDTPADLPKTVSGLFA